MGRVITLVFALLINFSAQAEEDKQSGATAQQAADFAGTGDENAPLPDKILEIGEDVVELRPAPNSDRNAYFGDLHVHTAYSFDAYAFGTTASPYDAYRFARGESIKHPSGYPLKLRDPLDFYAVTDHAMFLGTVKAAADTSTDVSKLPLAKGLHNINAPENMGPESMPQRSKVFATFLPSVLAGLGDGSIDKNMLTDVTKSAWRDTIRAAEMYNDPGNFTTFIAYEYTSSTDDLGNLHRNVVFKGGDKAPAVPFSRFHSKNPEGLWDWMDGLRTQGIESLAIPHNSNGSNGQMFKLVDWAGSPLDDSYARQRMRNEPIVEITQVKGTSDTHPKLSDNDEWADFEIMPYRVATTEYSEPAGSYVRDAYLRGLAIESRGVENPYKFGLIGSSDTHVAATSDQEKTFFSKAGLLDGTPTGRGSVPLSEQAAKAAEAAVADSVIDLKGKKYLATSSFETWGASGLAAVWAEENTRDSIYNALRRKETFATTGPRIKVRFFAGFDYDQAMLDNPKRIGAAYKRGVAMGTDLIADKERAPRFLVWAAGDGKGAPLQRVQIIKGYVNGDKHHEKVFDVACSDGQKVDQGTQRCPDNGARVNLADCSISTDVGDTELSTLWQDPEFDPSVEAFYYVRVLENPTCRWSAWDAIRAGVEPRPGLATTIQERAWSSPIWYKKPGSQAQETRME